MTKEQYRAQLQTDEWKALRAKILKRDKNTCTKCKASNCELHVHHKYYTEGKKAWEYPTKALTTLCSICHKKEHKGKSITDFIRPRVVKGIVYLPYVEPKRPKTQISVKKDKPKRQKAVKKVKTPQRIEKLHQKRTARKNRKKNK